MSNVYEYGPGAAVELPDVDELDQAEMGSMLAAFRRWRGSEPVHVEMADRQTALIVLAALQMAWRHPACPLCQVIQEFGRQIQDAICDQDDILEWAESGWRVERDR